MFNLFRQLKRMMYFRVANYFKYWAAMVLNKWQPTIIVITGSSGKTTLLHLLESQLGGDAIYSHQANSAFGVPFHILGLKRSSYALIEWPILFFKAPFKAIFRKIPKEKLYVVEADAERPGEAELIATLLKPEIVIWLSLGQAHGASYDRLVREGAFSDVYKAIAYEYGHCLKNAQKLVIINNDNEYIRKQLARTSVERALIKKENDTQYSVSKNSSTFVIHGVTFTIPALVPRDTEYAIQAIAVLMNYLGKKVDTKFSGFTLPPSRSSVFEGIKNSTIIDSSYNATIEGMKVMLDILSKYPAENKWAVLGDMLEQGINEASEHAALADIIVSSGAKKVVLVGPRLKEHTLPLLHKTMGNNVIAFCMPDKALKYLQEEIKGEETILFKGARFLEGIVEKLLANPEDAAKLCRRETVWVNRRKKWNL